MNIGQIREALELYDIELKAEEIFPIKIDPDHEIMVSWEYLEHVRWCAKEALTMLEGIPDQARVVDLGEKSAAKVEKAMRWLGFIQGALWMNGRYTINDLRHHSKFGTLKNA